MKKSICIEKIFLELPFEERFAAVKEAGFEYLEFCSWVDKDIPAVKRLAEQYGLKIAAISGDNNYSMIIPDHRKPFLEYLKRSIDVANTIGCEHLVLHSNAVDEYGVMADTGEEYSDVTKIAAAALAMQDAAALAEQAGVTLVIGALNIYTKPGYYMCRTRQTGALARAVGSERVKILYDTFHMQQMEGNIVATLREYRDVLGYIHIGDVPERFEPGTGEINWDRFKKELRDLQYDGIVGFELTPQISSGHCAEILRKF